MLAEFEKSGEFDGLDASCSACNKGDIAKVEDNTCYCPSLQQGCYCNRILFHLDSCLCVLLFNFPFIYPYYNISFFNY